MSDPTQLNITFMDTGFVNAKNEGTQVSVGNRVDNGSAFLIKANNIVPNSKMNGAANIELGGLTLPEFNIGSLEIPQIKITGILDSNVAADRLDFIKLWKLPQTFGYKATFYNVDQGASSVTRKRDEQMINMLANDHIDTSEPQ